MQVESCKDCPIEKECRSSNYGLCNTAALVLRDAKQQADETTTGATT